MMEHTTYHQLLRVTVAVVALVLVFDSGIWTPGTDQISENAQHYVANAIGVSVGIPETELNVITAELTKQRTELAEREQAIAEREIQLQQNPVVVPQSRDTSTFVLSAILFILLVLIVLNYGLDYARARQSEVVYVAKA